MENIINEIFKNTEKVAITGLDIKTRKLYCVGFSKSDFEAKLKQYAEQYHKNMMGITVTKDGEEFTEKDKVYSFNKEILLISVNPFNPNDYEEDKHNSKVYKNYTDCEKALHDYILNNIYITEIERSKLYSAFIDSLFEDEQETSTKWNDFFCKAIIKRNNK